MDFEVKKWRPNVVLECPLKTILDTATNLELIGQWLPSIRLSKSFIFCQFAFIARNGNQTTHEMASKGMLRQEEAFWVKDVSSLTLNRAAIDRRCMDQP
ncbi:hypothetical protein CXB51_021383 [Gossypium anomalum]|uniref:RNase H type-1 domain-containing protein n=1 Tax=Gossypium anomalum TaxID=47600 RepID=A0A8J6CX08_9ROSI|nr:hypothetical protein CXB51_021383 [Gossypium anomalum]